LNTTPDFLFASADASGHYFGRRAASMAASIALHAAVVAALVLLPRDWSLYVSPRPYADADVKEESRPERFVLYYQPPELPAISPAAPDQADQPIDPDVLAMQRMVSLPEVPTLNQTRVYLPDAPPQSQEKVEAENVVIVNPEPEPEPVRRVAPKSFTAPAPRKTERAVIEADTPVLQATAPGPLIPATTSALVDLPDAPPRPATGPEAAQPESAPAATAQGTEVDPLAKSSATVAVVTPNPAAGKPPASSAEADFRVGPPGPRNPAGTGLGSVEGAVTSVPNLAVSAAGPPRASSPPPPGSALPSRRPVTTPYRTLLSVALRPGLRRLPGPVEAAFGPRDVYVYLLETRLEGRRGPDWTMWFADVAETQPGRPPLFRPPVPMIAISVAELLAASPAEGKTVLVRGIVRRSGQFEAAEQQEDDTRSRLARLLRATPFLPATRNGADTDVDVVIEARGVR
jgi:hypothetical protein